jgi:RHS repeat-associated protein
VETGLDYFGARYYSGAQGRFISADLVGGDIGNPQSLNRYVYVLNNPLKFSDPTGLYECAGSRCDDLEEALKLQRVSNNDDVARAAGAYGAKGDKNGVHVTFKDLSKENVDGKSASDIGEMEREVLEQNPISS